MSVTTLISAHRGGAGHNVALENTAESIEQAIELRVDYIEFDVQRCADGVFVAYHDDSILVNGEYHPVAEMTFASFAENVTKFLTYTEVLTLIAGRCKAHIDFKFRSPQELPTGIEPYEITATKLALEALGTEQFIVTTMEDESVRILRDWSEQHAPWLLVGLSLGRNVSELSLLRALETRLAELLPSKRMRESRANLLVANHRLARWTLYRWAKKNDMPMLVWTVDEVEDIRRWSRQYPAWMLTSNYPDRAISVRDE